jgi:hypothetical protein
MPHYREKRVRQFYDALAEVAKMQGYEIDFSKEIGYPLNEDGKRKARRELIQQGCAQQVDRLKEVGACATKMTRLKEIKV